MINFHDQFVTQTIDKTAVQMFSGACSIHNVGINQGGLLLSHGGDSIDIQNVWSNGTPNPKTGTVGSYFFFTGDNPTAKLRWDNSMNGKWIQQAKVGETAVRLQQQDDCQCTGLKILSSGNKQCFQIRPGGKETDHFGQVVLIDCIGKGYKKGVKAVLDLGGIDLVDAHFPGGRLDLVKLVRCTFDAINITHCEKEHKRIKCIRLIDCLIGGKKFSGQWSY